jgi:hypothetical protein
LRKPRQFLAINPGSAKQIWISYALGVTRSSTRILDPIGSPDLKEKKRRRRKEKKGRSDTSLKFD